MKFIQNTGSIFTITSISNQSQKKHIYSETDQTTRTLEPTEDRQDEDVVTNPTICHMRSRTTTASNNKSSRQQR